MIHFNDDKLLEYALETASDDSGRAEIEAHLAVCPGCRDRLDEIRKDIEIIGSIRPLQPVLSISPKRTHSDFIYRALRTAALIILGIAMGFGASKLVYRQPATVLPAYFTLSPPPDSVRSYVAADVTGLSSDYYKRIVGGSE